MSAQEDLLSTREVVRILNVGPSTVKRWADEGSLPCVKTQGGHRRFRRRDIERLLGVQGAQQTRRAVGIDQWLDALLSQKPIEAVIARLMAERARLRSWWRTADYLGEVLGEVGLRWSLGQLSVLDEHVISERFARAVAWVSQTLPVRRAAPRCLLATAVNDEHTLGLSLTELTAREAGFDTTWTGRNSPLQGILTWIESRNLEVLAISASGQSQDAAILKQQLDTLGLAAAEQGIAIVVGGRGAWPEQHPHAHRVHSCAELHRLLASIRPWTRKARPQLVGPNSMV